MVYQKANTIQQSQFKNQKNALDACTCFRNRKVRVWTTTSAHIKIQTPGDPKHMEGTKNLETNKLTKKKVYNFNDEVSFESYFRATTHWYSQNVYVSYPSRSSS